MRAGVRWFHCFGRILMLTCLMALLHFSIASPAGNRPSGPRSIPEFVAAFNANYRPPVFEQESLYAAEAALLATEQSLLPRATFAEHLVWDDYSALGLDFGLALDVPLHSSVASMESDLAAINLESRRLALEAARADANAMFLVELANLSALGWVRELVTQALVAFDLQASRWHDGSLGYSGYVPPGERPAFENYLKLRDAVGWFGEQFEAGEQRLERSLALPAGGLVLPPLTAVEDFLAELATTLPDARQCRATSVNGDLAQLRSRSGTLDDELRSRSRFTIALTADLGYAFPSWPTSGSAIRPPTGASYVGYGTGSRGGLNAAVALEARLLVPDGWPLAGNTTIVVSPERSEQSVEISWPPLPTAHEVVSDRGEDLSDELQGLEAEFLAMRSAWSQAVRDRKLLERRLTWAIVDAAPDLAPEVLSSLVDQAVSHPNLYFMAPPAGDATQNPEGALMTVEIRVQHAFARVAVITAHASYLAACGRL